MTHVWVVKDGNNKKENETDPRQADGEEYCS